MSDCTLYIDEAGDLGMNRGSDWFVLSGVLANKSDEAEIRDVIKNIRVKLNLNEIHFRKMVSFDKKVYVVSELSKCNFEYITIIADTNKLNLSKFHSTPTQRPSMIFYNHICRFLIEKASWLLRDTNRTADIMLSSRGTNRDNELIDYMKKIISYKDNKIEPRFSSICAKSASSWDMLQLADVCATSMYNMHQLNGLGFITPCYTHKLQSHLYRYNGKTLLKYGMKYYDDAMAPDKNYFKDHTICNR